MSVRYFHGSFVPFPRGARMAGRGDAYEKAWMNTDFYAVLERHRPASCLPHRDAVFMVESVDDIDLAGGATEFCLEVQPIGPISRHDMNWSSEISSLISDGADKNSPEVIQAAQAYWSGQPHPNESVWEVLAHSLIVLRCDTYEGFDESQPAAPWHETLHEAPRSRPRSSRL